MGSLGKLSLADPGLREHMVASGAPNTPGVGMRELDSWARVGVGLLVACGSSQPPGSQIKGGRDLGNVPVASLDGGAAPACVPPPPPERPGCENPPVMGQPTRFPFPLGPAERCGVYGGIGPGDLEDNSLLFIERDAEDGRHLVLVSISPTGSQIGRTEFVDNNGLIGFYSYALNNGWLLQNFSISGSAGIYRRTNILDAIRSSTYKQAPIDAHPLRMEGR